MGTGVGAGVVHEGSGVGGFPGAHKDLNSPWSEPRLLDVGWVDRVWVAGEWCEGQAEGKVWLENLILFGEEG